MTTAKDFTQYGSTAISHLEDLIRLNETVIADLVSRIVTDVKQGKSLFSFGSGHSAIFTMELYHRAGGCSFLIPIFADYLLPTAGPPVVRVLERTPQAANMMLARAETRPSEMIWIASQSGVNSAVVDFAIEAKRLGLYTVAFTSKVHSGGVPARHASGKRLMDVCDQVVDFGGHIGDACMEIAPGVRAGPLSSLSSIFLGHSILTAACQRLELQGHRCTYTSVNTPEGEGRNREIEMKAKLRDPLLKG